MKNIIFASLAASVILVLSGCGNNNSVQLPTKAAITFAVMSSNITPQPEGQDSSTTGVQYIIIRAAVPGFTNISGTTSSGPAQTGVVNTFLRLPIILPSGATRISASALLKAGIFSNNSSVSNRTKITGYFSNDQFQNAKNISIFLVYSSPRTPGAVIVTGDSIDFATLNVTFPAGKVTTGDVFKDICLGLWVPNESNPSLFFFYNSTSTFTNTVPTVSQAILGF